MKFWKSPFLQGALIALIATLAAFEVISRTGVWWLGIPTFFVASLLILRFVEDA